MVPNCSRDSYRTLVSFRPIHVSVRSNPDTIHDLIVSSNGTGSYIDAAHPSGDAIGGSASGSRAVGFTSWVGSTIAALAAGC